LRGLP